MSLRTASTTQNRQTLLDLQRTQQRLALTQTQIGTGKRLTGPGDDPTAAALILDFGNSIEANTQYIKQANSAGSYLSSSEDAVSAAIESSIQAQVLATQGVGTNVTAASRAAMVSQVDAIFNNLQSLANTRSQGKYLFAGTQTQTIPFATAVPSRVPPYVPGNGPIAYAGNGGAINLDVTATTSVTTNVPGNTVFFGAGGEGSTTDIFKAVSDLRDGLASNDTVKIQSAADNLQFSFANLNQVQADLGGRQAGLFALKDLLSGANVTLQGLQNTQQDTDYPAAAVQLSADQTMQSVTLSALAKSNKTNLFDYLA